MVTTSWSDQILFCTVLIETEFYDDEDKSGTGFFYFRRLQGSRGAEFLVTCRHVVDLAKTAWITFHGALGGRANIGNARRVEVDPRWWLFHPDDRIDVAILPTTLLENEFNKAGGVFYKNIDDQARPTAEQLDDTFPIEDVTFVGYPNRLFDRKHYLPIIRKGTTATPPLIDYNDEPAFLISASVFPGSSGSPVFLHDAVQYATRKGTVSGPGRLWFLGILSGFKYREAPGWVEIDDAPAMKTKIAAQEAIDLGIVFKDAALRSAIDHHLKERAGIAAEN